MAQIAAGADQLEGTLNTGLSLARWLLVLLLTHPIASVQAGCTLQTSLLGRGRGMWGGGGKGICPQKLPAILEGPVVPISSSISYP